MRIGVDIRVLMDSHYSGIANYTANLLNTLLKHEDDNTYHLFYNSFRDIRFRMDRWSTNRSQILSTRWPNKIFNYLGQKLLTYPKIDKKLNKVDIFWSPHFNFTNLSKETKHVLTIHDLSFMRYPEFFSRRKNFWHQSLNLPKLVKNCNSLVAVSENTKKDIIDLLPVLENKVNIIYSGLDKTRAEISDDKVKKFLINHNLKPGFILYLGNIEPRKNICGLIYAYNLLRDHNVSLVDTQLVLAGARAWKSNAIFQARENSPYRDDIKFIGYVDKNEKEVLYQQAKIFTYPSFYEGFGFPPLEAMARSLPVITSNVSSLPEVVGDAALTINPYDVNDLAKAMELLIKDKELYDFFVNKGIKQANKFLWSKTASQYLQLFKQLAYEKK